MLNKGCGKSVPTVKKVFVDRAYLDRIQIQGTCIAARDYYLHKIVS
jgi:hypothetical protein